VDSAWYGLWHASPHRRESLVNRLIIYAVTPLALAMLFNEFESLHRFTRAYLTSLMFTCCIGGTCELSYRFVWPRVFTRKPSWPLRIAGHALTIVVAVGLGVAVAFGIGALLFGWKPEWIRLWLQSIVISGVIITILVATDELGARSRELERREAMHRVAVLRAELSALQARTDPHFLFNSLNAVAALIPANPALAESLLERLAAVFRYALDAGRRDSVELADEIAAVTAYLEVEALRLGSRLRWHLDRGPDLDGVRVPPLVLQPLVENAIRHGAGGRIGATEVNVSARRAGDDIVLAVEDRGVDGAAATAVGGGAGTALADLRARLELVYAGRARLAVGAADAGWRAEIVLPAERAP
jgi:two-component system, LytTR family, sensor histidine kinase AlgZ